MSNQQIIVFDKRETVAQSVVKDGVTFGLLILCVWVSNGSKWWTFFTALMFIVFLGGKLAAAVSTRQHKFKSPDELIAWAEKERSNT